MPTKRASNEAKKPEVPAKPGETAPSVPKPLKWHSPMEAPFRLAGFAWFKVDRLYRRLPLHPIEKLPQSVDSLANCTAGGQIRFQAVTSRLSVKVRLNGVADMNHMPATGQCGFDCYLGPTLRQRYCSTTKYDHRQSTYTCTLFELPRAEKFNVTLNFPLYRAVEEVHVGLDEGAEVLPPPPYENDGRVIVYGTSITQGGCASRPGMAYTNILSRRFNREFINLGFSGSGRGEPEVAKTMAEIANPGLFVLDYEGNCESTERLRESFPEFIRILREAHPRVPILAVSRIPFAVELINDAAFALRLERKVLERETVDSLRAAGDGLVHFLDGSTLLGEDFDECTVDGVHPCDLGFMRIADGLTPVLRKILDEFRA